jgi:hypothetical protein
VPTRRFVQSGLGAHRLGQDAGVTIPFPGLQASVVATGEPLPEPRAHVRLLTGTGRPIPARVLTRRGRTLTLATVLPIPVLSRKELAALTLEFEDRLKRVRLTGQFAQPSRESPELIELLDAEPHQPSADERFHVRVHAVRTAVLYAAGWSMPIRGWTVDISGGGFLARGAEFLRVGDEVAFEIWLDGADPPFDGTARVVRVDPTGGRGMVYERVAADQWRRVADFVRNELAAELEAATPSAVADERLCGAS